MVLGDAPAPPFSFELRARVRERAGFSLFRHVAQNPGENFVHFAYCFSPKTCYNGIIKGKEGIKK